MRVSDCGWTHSYIWVCQVSGSGDPLKKLFKQKKLCYSVEEAVKLDVFRFAWPTSSRSDRDDLLLNQVLDFGRSYGTPEELPANMYGCGKVCLVNILSVFFLNGCVRGKQFTEVVYGKSGKALLGNVPHLFALKQA